jgi:hypothetical protein
MEFETAVYRNLPLKKAA